VSSTWGRDITRRVDVNSTHREQRDVLGEPSSSSGDGSRGGPLSAGPGAGSKEQILPEKRRTDRPRKLGQTKKH